MRLTLTPQGEALLLEALAVYTALIDKVMAQSSPRDCDMLGEQMRRIETILAED
jgi:DNA-binding MarR family transcriptional regulator